MSGLGTRDFNGLWNEKKTFIPHSHNIISIQIHRHSQALQPQMPCQSAESVQNNTHQPTKRVQRKHCMQSTFEDDICCVSNIIVYDKVSDDFIFLSIKGTCPNQNLVAHHQFLDNLPGKASM